MLYLCFNYYILLIMFFACGLMVFFFNFKYLLINLLSVEFMMLSLLMNVFINLLNFNFEMFFLMVFLTFIVCESVLGLSLLISLINILGDSNLQNLNLLKN